jgi:hypothetical protein
MQAAQAPPPDLAVRRRGPSFAVGAAVVAGWIAFASCAAAAPAGPEAAETEARALAEEVLARPGYQTELPAGAGEDGAEEGSEGWRARHGGGWKIPVPRGSGALLEILAWVVAAAVAVLLLTALVRSLLGGGGRGRARSRRMEAPPRPENGSGAASPGRLSSLAEAERLAADGRYGEAARLLLARALRTVADGRGRAFPESATSREILGARTVSPGVRAPLGVLVTAVEPFLFGGAELGARDWERCRSAYDALGEG